MTDIAAKQDALVSADRISKTYPDGQVRALVDVSLQIRRGQYLAVMGPSGCGKSTLLNILGALDRPTKGEVSFEGQSLGEMRSLDRFRSRKLGFVFQSFHLLPVLTALENVQVPMFETDRSAAQRVREARRLIELVGLTHRADHLPRNLSVGERQRVAVARALANDPVLLLADEPTGNLDSASTRDVLDLLTRLHEDRSTTLVVVTHDPESARRAERIIRMQDGRIVSDG